MREFLQHPVGDDGHQTTVQWRDPLDDLIAAEHDAGIRDDADDDADEMPQRPFDAEALTAVLMMLAPSHRNPDSPAYWRLAFQRLALLQLLLLPEVSLVGISGIARATGFSKALLDHHLQNFRANTGMPFRAGKSAEACESYSTRQAEIWKQRPRLKKDQAERHQARRAQSV